MDQQQQSRRRPTGTQVLWIAIGVAGLFAAIVVFGGYYFEWKWTGYPKRTPWDWVDLLIVPIVLALGGYLFTRSENQRTQRIGDERRQDDTLQAYLDGIAQLLTDKDRPLYRAQRGDSLSAVARARTLTVLSRLDGDRKGTVVQFLYESGLITRDRAVVDLRDADLRGAVLIRAVLFRARLSGAVLSGANLNNASLSIAKLKWANLSQANLRGAVLEEADLSHANLIGADLTGAKLVHHMGALGMNFVPPPELRHLGRITREEAHNLKLVTMSTALKGATMPDGQKYEDWCNDPRTQTLLEKYRGGK